jgi:hypothetical protein
LLLLEQLVRVLVRVRLVRVLEQVQLGLELLEQPSQKKAL